MSRLPEIANPIRALGSLDYSIGLVAARPSLPEVGNLLSDSGKVDLGEFVKWKLRRSESDTLHTNEELEGPPPSQKRSNDRLKSSLVAAINSSSSKRTAECVSFMPVMR
jgi:hypothetical protein